MKRCYDNGKLNGTSEFFDFDGKVTSVREFRNGEKFGIWKFTNPEGVYKTQNHNIINDKSYEEIWYHPNGKIKEIGKISKGRRNGVWKYYDSKGKHWRTIEWENGKVLPQINQTEN